MSARDSYDEQLIQLGRGVAGAFESYCGRYFSYSDSHIQEWPGLYTNYVLDRYPVNALSELSYMDSDSGEWIELDPGVDARVQSGSGLIHVMREPSVAVSRFRATYSGGYWFDDTEELTGTKPDGATKLPADILDAWLLQCEAVFASRDALGLTLARQPEDSTYALALHRLQLTEYVRRLLDRYVRLQVI